ncbi:MAG TPA: hypothetical protein VMV59_12140 [Candidatus Dormibacteraeota bacterium]|nr:hypothetical protein [Candidatus Dormibacteraeota bacterium]
MNTHSRSDAEKQVPEYSRIATPTLRSKPKAHQIIRRARPTQFRRHGRKFRVNQERDLRVMRALARYDRGAGVWVCLDTLLAEVRKVEAGLDGGAVRMTWSKRTLVRSLARLRGDELIASHEIRRKERARWGSRTRSLHPEKFLPRECGARSKAECGALEVKGFELHTSVKQDTADTRKSIAPVLSHSAFEPKDKTPDEVKKSGSADDAFLGAFRVLSYRMMDPLLAACVVMWVAYRALRAGTTPKTIAYYLRSEKECPAFSCTAQGEAMLAEAHGRLMKICPKANRLVQQIFKTPIYRQAEQVRDRDRGGWTYSLKDGDRVVWKRWVCE